MLDFLTMYAQKFPAKLAVVDDRPDEMPRSMTFAEFNRYANRLANGLIDAGLPAGSKAMWCGKNSLELMAFMHAARKAGMVMVPMNYRLSEPEAIYVVNDSDAMLVFADAEFAELFATIRAETPGLKEVVIFAGRPLPGQVSESSFLGDESDPDIVLLEHSGNMIYTSGTTGKPKGAVRHQSASQEQGEGLRDLVGYDTDDIYLTCGPLYHSGPGGFALASHARGSTIVLQHRFDAEDWLRLIDKYKCSSTFSAPTPIRMVCNLPAETCATYDLSSMRIMIANAAPWPFSLKQQYVGVFPPESLWEIYGSTELGVNTVLAPEDQLRKPGSCGKPAPYVEVSLLDDEGREIT
ncbi:MAG: class I adenylate-forming enzyme family protein, partial [Acidimicrobiales bacterium]